MKIILIIYIIGIVLYWLGIVSLISTMKKNKEQTQEAFKNRGESKRSYHRLNHSDFSLRCGVPLHFQTRFYF